MDAKVHLCKFAAPVSENDSANTTSDESEDCLTD